MTREDLTKKVTFELKLKWRKQHSNRGNGKCKGTVAEITLVYIKHSEEASEYREDQTREREQEMSPERKQGPVTQGPMVIERWPPPKYMSMS